MATLQKIIVWLLLLGGIVSCEEAQEKSLGEKEYFFHQRLSSVSPDADSALWLGSETGEIWHIAGDSFKNYDLGVDRIYKVLHSHSTPSGRVVWVGCRNAGLQRWLLTEQTATLQATYPIEAKGIRYSAYDLLTLGRALYVATSNGLFVLDPAQPDTLRKIFPDCSLHETLGQPCIINRLCALDSTHLVAATQQGLLDIDPTQQRIAHRYDAKEVSDVGYYGGKLYILADKSLYVERPDGTCLDSVNFDFKPRAYCQMERTHCIVRSHSLVMSEDLRHFETFPLRRSIPTRCHNVVFPHTATSHFALVTENALWQIPAHISTASGYAPVVASCAEADRVYTLNANNDLFLLHTSEAVARKVYAFPASEHIVQMKVDDGTLYYINSRMELKRLSLYDNWLQNELLSHPELVYSSKSNILTAAFHGQAAQRSVYLAVQDALIRIAPDGKADTIGPMKGKYITAFYTRAEDKALYCATLNDGIFRIALPQVKSINATSPFVRDLLVVGDFAPQLLILTHRQLIATHPADTLAARGLNRLIPLSDSLFYALPEYGIERYALQHGRWQRTNTFFRDIHFIPQAVTTIGQQLYCGTPIGTLTFAAGHEAQAQWMAEASPWLNLRILLAGLAGLLLLIALSAFFYRRQRQATLHQRQLQVDDLQQRLQVLHHLAPLLPHQTATEVAQLHDQLADMATADPDTSTLRQLSHRIAILNRDGALHISQLLDQQVALLHPHYAYERDHLLAQSAQAKATGNIERIADQVAQNDAWCSRIKTIEHGLQQARNLTLDAAMVEGVNTALPQLIAQVEAGLQQQPLAQLVCTFESLQSACQHAQSAEALQSLAAALTAEEARAATLTSFAPTAEALQKSLDELRVQLPQLERPNALQQLHQLCLYVRQYESLLQLRGQMEAFSAVRQRVIAANEQRIHQKFSTSLEAEIVHEADAHIQQIEQLLGGFYDSLMQTDAPLVRDVLQLQHLDNQPTKVLALLLAHPKVKRLHLPGMLGVFGNLNPVISRLVNGRIKPQLPALQQYAAAHPLSIATHIIQLS